MTLCGTSFCNALKNKMKTSKEALTLSRKILKNGWTYFKNLDFKDVSPFFDMHEKIKEFQGITKSRLRSFSTTLHPGKITYWKNPSSYIRNKSSQLSLSSKRQSTPAVLMHWVTLLGSLFVSDYQYVIFRILMGYFDNDIILLAWKELGRIPSDVNSKSVKTTLQLFLFHEVSQVR